MTILKNLVLDIDRRGLRALVDTARKLRADNESDSVVYAEIKAACRKLVTERIEYFRAWAERDPHSAEWALSNKKILSDSIDVAVGMLVSIARRDVEKGFPDREELLVSEKRIGAKFKANAGLN